MSWRHLIDTRQEKARVDWPRLIIVLVATEVIAGVLIRLLSESVGPLALILIVVPIVALLIALDGKLRGQDYQDQ